jgi:hypothetical protein
MGNEHPMKSDATAPDGTRSAPSSVEPTATSAPPYESREMVLRDIGAISQISAVPSMLDMICSESGMGFAAVARVSDTSWTACAVKDNVNFGLKPGGQLDLHTTLCHESRGLGRPSLSMTSIRTPPIETITHRRFTNSAATFLSQSSCRAVNILETYAR